MMGQAAERRGKNGRRRNGPGKGEAEFRRRRGRGSPSPAAISLRFPLSVGLHVSAIFAGGNPEMLLELRRKIQCIMITDLFNQHLDGKIRFAGAPPLFSSGIE